MTLRLRNITIFEELLEDYHPHGIGRKYKLSAMTIKSICVKILIEMKEDLPSDLKHHIQPEATLYDICFDTFYNEFWKGRLQLLKKKKV